MNRFGRPSRRVAIGGAAALVVVVLLWWVALWSPRQQAYNQAHADALSQQATVQQLQAELSRLRSDQSQLPAAQTRLATERAAIPAGPQLPQLILQINSAADQAGVSFLTISPSLPAASAPVAAAPATAAPVAPSTTGATGSTPAGPLGANPAIAPAVAPPNIKLSINITGGYYQVLDFINRIDTLPRLMVIDGLSVSHGGSGGAELTVSITARAFTSQLTTPGTASAGGAGSGATTATSTTSTTSPTAGSTTTTRATP